jgi:thioredoxin-like negative regulator of GroEL
MIQGRNQTSASEGRLARLAFWVEWHLPFLPWEQWAERGWRPAALGMPGALAIVAVLCLACTILLAPMSHASSAVEERASASLDHGQYDAARIGFERTLQQNPGDLLATFGLAITLRHLGEPEAAATLLARLAPLGDNNEVGFMPAHLLLAQELLAGPAPSHEAVKSAEAHLDRIVKTDPNQPTANALLAMIYLQSDRWGQCRDALQHCMGYVDDKGVEIAKLCFAHGERQLGRKWAQRAAAHYQLRCDRNPQDDVARLQLSRAQVAAGDGPQAAELLWSSWKQTHQEMFRVELTHLYDAVRTSNQAVEKYTDLDQRLQELMRS